MADGPGFRVVCELLERDTSLDRLEARGTVRLALKEAGLEAATATPEQLAVVVARILPEELRVRGVADVDAVSRRIQSELAELPGSIETSDRPDAIFERLGSG